MPILTRNNNVLTAGGKVLIREATPLDLPNLKLYLSATKMAQYADGTAIPSFLDYSGNNYHAMQVTSAKQPLFKTNQFGTQAGINFDGVDDALDFPSAVGDILKNINQFTVQYLAKRNTIGTSHRGLYLGQQTSGSFRLLIQFSPTGLLQSSIWTIDGGSPTGLSAPSNDLNPHLIQITMGTNYLVSLYLDGVLVASGTAPYLTPFSNVSGINNSLGYINQAIPTYGDGSINGLSINASYSDYATIQAQYRGYLYRGYL